MNSVVFVVENRHTSNLVFKDCFVPIYTGKKDYDTSNGYRDDSGVNIANKNDRYAELTAHYWIWKNLGDIFDNVGLCHYRRFFTYNRFSNSNRFFLKEKDFNKILSQYDVILPTPYKWSKSVAEIFYVEGAGLKGDLDIVEGIIEKDYSDYLQSFRDIIYGNTASYRTICVMKWKLLENYYQWLFDVLGKAEPLIYENEHSPSETRAVGFIAELLLNVWVEKNGLKIKYVDITQTDESLKDKIKNEVYHYSRFHIMANALRRIKRKRSCSEAK